jgi:uncharacterized membrane protein
MSDIHVIVINIEKKGIMLLAQNLAILYLFYAAGIVALLVYAMFYGAKNQVFTNPRHSQNTPDGQE